MNSASDSTATYDWTQQVNKRLALIGAGPGRTSVRGSLSLVSLLADQPFTIVNIDALQTSGAAPTLPVTGNVAVPSENP